MFSKLAASSEFWQVPLSPESALLTTFITLFGRFCSHRLLFGIMSAPEHFQRGMSEALTGLTFVVCMIDYIHIHGRAREEHDTCLKEILVRLQETGVTLNTRKCKFTCTTVKFLGQIKL